MPNAKPWIVLTKVHRYADQGPARCFALTSCVRETK